MNFQKLFEDYKIPYSTKINRGWINTNCPYDDIKADSFNMGFNPAGSGYCTCWKCGGNDLNRTLSLLLGIPRTELPAVLSQYEGRSGVLQELNKKTAKAKHLELPNQGFTSAERKYLLSRNFSPRFLHEKYGVVGGGIAGDWKYRIIIPLYYKGVLVSWTGRSILDKQTLKDKKIPRYKNLAVEKSVINPKECLFNIDNCNDSKVILTEGAFDVMRFGSLSLSKKDNIMCSFGTELTQAQVKIIAERFEKVFIMFDNEPEAQKKARKFGMQIASIGVEVEVVDAYSEFDKNDGGELSDEEVKKIRTELGL